MVRIPVGIIHHRLALDRFLGDFERNAQHAIRTGGGQNRQLERTQRLSDITVGFLRQVVQRRGISDHFKPAKPALHISKRAF